MTEKKSRACSIKDLGCVPVTTRNRPRHFLICRRKSSVFPEFGETKDIRRHVGDMSATYATKLTHVEKIIKASLDTSFELVSVTMEENQGNRMLGLSTSQKSKISSDAPLAGLGVCL